MSDVKDNTYEEGTLEYLDRKMREAEDGKDAEGFAKAYQARLEADTLMQRERAKNKIARAGNRSQLAGMFLGQVIGVALGNFIKVKGDLIFQKNAMLYEDAGKYVNTRKWKR